MRLWLVRHAVAAPSDPGGRAPDAERPLTPDGRRRFARAVARLAANGERLGSVHASPLRRAVETADLLAPLGGGEPRPTPLLARAPGPELVALVAGHAADGRPPALVGHEPWTGELLALLACGAPPGGAAAVRIAKGALALLEGEPRPGGMRLLCLLRVRDLEG